MAIYELRVLDFGLLFQHSDTVGWATGRAFGLYKKTGCTFVIGDLELCNSYSSICHHHLRHP